MSLSDDLKCDPKVCPPEIFEKFKVGTVSLIQGRAYAKVRGRNESVARLVWRCHHPNTIVPFRMFLYHRNKDKLDNRKENLTPDRNMVEK